MSHWEEQSYEWQVKAKQLQRELTKAKAFYAREMTEHAETVREKVDLSANLKQLQRELNSAKADLGYCLCNSAARRDEYEKRESLK